MIPRIGQLLIMSTVAAMFAVGCQKPGGDEPEPEPLSKEEAAKYRQVKVKVTGAT